MRIIPNYKKIVEDVFKEVQNLLIFYPIQGSSSFSNYLKNVKNFSNEVENNIIFRADSFSVSVTYASLLIERGLPDWAIRIISCLTEMKNIHFVCLAFGLVLDNREIDIYYMNHIGYECTSYCKFGDYNNWRPIEFNNLFVKKE